MTRPSAHRAPDPISAAQYLRVSSEMQRYSIEAQSVEIAAFAAAHGYRIVETYADSGKSGLRLKGRLQLQRLLAEALGGQARFTAILIQDVSRWGRFQDPDEAAHYEYLCRSAGIEVRYCSESFGAALSPIDGVLKAVKRLMAAEFSRELSGKTRNAQRRWAAAGFKMGGVAGYGLRRCVVGADGRRKGILAPGETKLLQSDRVVLEHGPPHEVDTVRRIYRLYLHGGVTLAAIAELLNSEGTLGECGRPWGAWSVAQVLGNAKYMGDYIFGRRARTLDGRRVRGAEDQLLRVVGALSPIVSRRDFEAVRAKRRRRMLFVSEDQMLAAAADLQARHGQLTVGLLNSTPDVPSARTFRHHFGPINRLHARLGHYPLVLSLYTSKDELILPGYIDAQGATVSRISAMAQTTTTGPHPAPTFTAFAGDRLIAAGSLGEVALTVKAAALSGATNVLILDDATGGPIDLDLRGSDADILGRFSSPPSAPETLIPARPGRGRPKLGVAAREVTLLPRHWAWLARQPGGASAALRKLVEQAARDSVEIDAAREAQTAAYKAMYALAGHLPHFEDALRALYEPNLVRLLGFLDGWPSDIRAYVERLARIALERPTQKAN